MIAALDDAALIQHQNLVRADHGGEAVRDHQRRAPARDFVEARLDFALGLGVERRGRLVEHQDARPFEDDARDGDALFLAARKFEAALADRAADRRRAGAR